jgi:hypothetical protein
VPVTPTSSSRRVGSPKKTSAATAMATRESGTTTCGTATSTGCSTTSAAAPAATAPGAWSWPSVLAPGTQKKRAPLATRRAS